MEAVSVIFECLEGFLCRFWAFASCGGAFPTLGHLTPQKPIIMTSPKERGAALQLLRGLFLHCRRMVTISDEYGGAGHDNDPSDLPRLSGVFSSGGLRRLPGSRRRNRVQPIECLALLLPLG